MKRWKAISFCVIVAVILLFASRVWSEKRQQQRELQALECAEAHLAALAAQEVESIRIFSFGEEELVEDPDDIREILQVIARIRPEISPNHNLGRYEESEAGASPMRLWFLCEDGGERTLALNDFNADTPHGTVCFRAKLESGNAVSAILEICE